LARKPQTTHLRDSFESLLRAAADVSEIPIGSAPFFQRLQPGSTLGDGRFGILRVLGKGGMGTVFEAVDRHLQRAVALKVLGRADARSVARFKKEFRLLADTVHPHLVRLHDLFVENGTWFFTMDLIEGSTLTAHLARAGPIRSVERERELRRVFAQLVDGVSAIHAKQHLHRDLKPENVLVSRDGCVVIVDFGLLAHAPLGPDDGQALNEVAGTVPYMAPEQARAEHATPASDWYAAGTILYEALTGERPLSGDTSSLLEQKRRGEAPRLFVDGGPWPGDLVDLCRALLSPTAESRPGPEAIRHKLGSALSQELAASDSREPAPALAPAAGALSSGPKPVFVGRSPELATLFGALDRARSGALVVCRVSGPAGIGKTALVAEFLRRSSATGGCVALCGRCYEREAMPYKLLDGIADSLTQSLARLAAHHVPLLTPLLSLFPGLPLPAGVRPPETAGTSAEPELRDRAVRAVRACLDELLKVAPVVVHIDDVQWGDVDGVRLLDEILERPAPPVLLILAHRDGDSTDALGALSKTRLLTEAEVCDVVVPGLAASEVLEILGGMVDRSALDAALITRESEGNPYFAAEIIRHALQEGSELTPPNRQLTLGDTILSRCGRLPFGTRRVLDAVSLYNAPIALPLLGAAAGDVDVDRAVAMLRSASFVRTHRSRATTLVEPFHDRVREVIERALPDSARRSLHLTLARALEAEGSDNWEQMMTHFDGAGDASRAAECALRGADRAFAAQAFEHAAALYRRALKLGCWQTTHRRNLTARLGDALAMSGHAAQAAEEYENAASEAPTAERIRLQLLSSAQLLCTGRTTVGMARLAESVGYLGVKIPEPDELLPAAFACLEQSLAAAPGLVFRSEASIEEEQLLRLDACWWAAKGLFSSMPLVCYFFTCFHLAEAMRAREPMRIARAAYGQVAFTSAVAPAALLDTLTELAERAAAEAPGPNVRFWREHALAWRGFQAFDAGCTASHLEAAYAHAREAGHGLEREVTLLRMIEGAILYEDHDNAQAVRRIERWRRDASRRGDLVLMTWARCLDFRWWMDDAPELQWRDLNALREEVSQRSAGNELTIWFIDALICFVGRYMGRAPDVIHRYKDVFEQIRGSYAWGVPRHRVLYGKEFVACAIVEAQATQNHDVLKDAEGVLEQFPAPVSGMVTLLRAGIANVRGDHGQALRLLESAASDPGKSAARAVSMSATWFQGLLLGGARGRALVEAAEEDAHARGVANPWRVINTVWPGFGDHLGPFTPARDGAVQRRR
jgi:eukaryotic-like serine/threonine-protein kinase